MAYGMLTSFALGAAQGLGGAIVNKLSKDQDAEIKAKADAEREARIEEAAIRSEGRSIIREDLKYNKIRADTLADRESQYAQDYIVKSEDSQRRVDEDIAKENRAQKRENDPNTLAGQAKIAQINAANTTNQSQQLELQTKQKILKAGSEWENAKTDEERRAIEDRIKGLTGKVGDSVEFKTSTDIIGYDKNDKPITKTTMNWVDIRNRTVTPVEGTSTAPLTDKQLKATANAKANAAGGTDYKGYQEIKPSTWYGGDSEEEIKKKEEFNKVYTETLANGGKAPAAEKTQGGMLNSKTTDKTTDKAIEQTVKTATANPLIKFTDDPVKQGQFDTITGVLLYSESGLKGANVGRPKATPDNPHPTADGSYQLTNIAMKDLNIKPDLPNGEYSVEAKEKAAPDFYKKAYNATQGDASAFLAYRFSPPDIKQAVEKAKKEGGNWWDYAKSDLTKANMPIVIRDAARSMIQLSRENKEPPLGLQKFILANRNR
jgi:signal peptidase I